MNPPPTILDYAPPSRGVNWRGPLRVGIVSVLYGAIGSLLGWAVCPQMVYEATDVIEVSPFVRDVSDIREVKPRFSEFMEKNLTGIRSREHIEQMVVDLRNEGVSIRPEIVALSLHCDSPAGTNLIHIRFRHRDPHTAAAVVHCARYGFPLRQSTATPDPFVMESISTFRADTSIVSPISYARSFTASGFVAGFLVALLVLYYRRPRDVSPLEPRRGGSL